jgi:hypothetical protein
LPSKKNRLAGAAAAVREESTKRTIVEKKAALRITMDTVPATGSVA